MTVQTQIYLGNDNDITINRVQDCEPIIEHCTNLRNLSLSKREENRLEAIIPNVIVEIYLKKEGISMHEFAVNPEHIKRMVNSRELSKFRVTPGRV